MGVTWRRINERVLQMGSLASFSGKGFVATSNGRNEAMSEEATAFAKAIQTLQKDVTKVLKHVEVHFMNLRDILSSPVPQMFDEGPNGPVPVCMESVNQSLGQGMDVDAIPRAVTEARMKVETEVMDPLMEWMEAYKMLMERMKALESIRLELDSRRRTVNGLQSRHERLKATMTTNHKVMAEARELEDVLARKEGKMSCVLQQYQELERTLYNSFSTLIQDTSVLRDYTHSILTIFQSCFEKAATSYSCAASPHADAPPATTHKSKTKKLTKVFGKLMGKRSDTKHHADQTPLPLYDEPSAPQLLLTQDAYNNNPTPSHSQWPQQQPSAGPCISNPATSANSHQSSGYSNLSKQRGLDQHAGMDNYSGQDVGYNPVAHAPSMYSKLNEETPSAPPMAAGQHAYARYPTAETGWTAEGY